MLKLSNVCKEYNKESVLNGINIDIKGKNIVLITGSNGSGKSTILKIISGCIYKDSGELDNNISKVFMPDKYSLPRLTTTNAYLKAIAGFYNSKEDYKKYLTLFNIPNKKIKDLSKGNIVKLVIAHTLLIDRDLYIFDEPLDGLDEDSKKIFKEEILKKYNEGKIIIISLHNKNYFSDIATKVYEIKNGISEEKRKRTRKNLEEDSNEKKPRQRKTKVSQSI